MLESLVLFILLAPFAGALIAGFGWRFTGEKGAMLVTTGIMMVAAVFAWIVLIALPEGAESLSLFRWIDSGTLAIDWGIRLDRMTSVMLVVVCSVSALVHLYSMGYMEEDDAKPRFFVVQWLIHPAGQIYINSLSLVPGSSRNAP